MSPSPVSLEQGSLGRIGGAMPILGLATPRWEALGQMVHGFLATK